MPGGPGRRLDHICSPTDAPVTDVTGASAFLRNRFGQPAAGRTADVTFSLAMMRRLLIAAIGAAVTLSAGCAAAPPRGSAPVFAVGDCVAVPVANPVAPSPVRASKVACDTDPSYTVGALTSGGAACPSPEYQHLTGQIADNATTRLCLVPNLVADHCYEMGMPVGVVELADCASRGKGVLVRVTQRLDVRDESACPAEAGQFAWPYPSPARTYCTRTIY